MRRKYISLYMATVVFLGTLLYGSVPHKPDLTLMVVGKSIRAIKVHDSELAIAREYDEIWPSIGNGLYETQLSEFEQFFVSLSPQQEEAAHNLFVRAYSLASENATHPIKILQRARQLTPRASTSLDSIVKDLGTFIVMLEYRPMVREFHKLRTEPVKLRAILATIHGKKCPDVLFQIMSKDRNFIKSPCLTKIFEATFADMKKS